MLLLVVTMALHCHAALHLAILLLRTLFYLRVPYRALQPFYKKNNNNKSQQQLHRYLHTNTHTHSLSGATTWAISCFSHQWPI